MRPERRSDQFVPAVLICETSTMEVIPKGHRSAARALTKLRHKVN